MEIETNVTVDDWINFSRHFHNTFQRYKRLKRHPFLALLFWTGIGIGLILIWDANRLERPHLWEYLAVLAVAVTAFALLAVHVNMRHWHWLRKLLNEGKNRSTVGRQKIILTEENIIGVNDVGELRTQWSGIEKIEETKDYIYIYLGVILAYIIPKRAFSEPEKAQEFLETAKRYLARVSA